VHEETCPRLDKSGDDSVLVEVKIGLIKTVEPRTRRTPDEPPVEFVASEALHGTVLGRLVGRQYRGSG
jgi:hypothetical protein